jgi:predicted RNase H-like HicB family nuclease
VPKKNRMLGYRTTNRQDVDGYWLVRPAVFENVVGYGSSAGEARVNALASLVQWINLLIENAWPIPEPVEAIMCL